MKILAVEIEEKSYDNISALLKSQLGVISVKEMDFDDWDSNDPGYLKLISQSLAENWDSEEDKVWDEIYKESVQNR